MGNSFRNISGTSDKDTTANFFTVWFYTHHLDRMTMLSCENTAAKRVFTLLMYTTGFKFKYLVRIFTAVPSSYCPDGGCI